MQPICSLYKCDAIDLLALRGTTDLFALQYNELNSLIQLGAIRPIHNGPMQIELSNCSRHINQRFHWLRNKFNEAHQLPAPLYERAATQTLMRAPSIEAHKKSKQYATYPDRDSIISGK